jgi:hypothetical protein
MYIFSLYGIENWNKLYNKKVPTEKIFKKLSLLFVAL